MNFFKTWFLKICEILSKLAIGSSDSPFGRSLAPFGPDFEIFRFSRFSNFFRFLSLELVFLMHGAKVENCYRVTDGHTNVYFNRIANFSKYNSDKDVLFHTCAIFAQWTGFGILSPIEVSPFVMNHWLWIGPDFLLLATSLDFKIQGGTQCLHSQRDRSIQGPLQTLSILIYNLFLELEPLCSTMEKYVWCDLKF